MQYVVGSDNTLVYINCISINNQGVHFAYSTPEYTEIFEMVRFANWLTAKRMVSTVNEAMIMLLLEASKVVEDIWININ